MCDAHISRYLPLFNIFSSLADDFTRFPSSFHKHFHLRFVLAVGVVNVQVANIAVIIIVLIIVIIVIVVVVVVIVVIIIIITVAFHVVFIGCGTISLPFMVSIRNASLTPYRFEESIDVRMLLTRNCKIVSGISSRYLPRVDPFQVYSNT